MQKIFLKKYLNIFLIKILIYWCFYPIFYSLKNFVIYKDEGNDRNFVNNWSTNFPRCRMILAVKCICEQIKIQKIYCLPNFRMRYYFELVICLKLVHFNWTPKFHLKSKSKHIEILKCTNAKKETYNNLKLRCRLSLCAINVILNVNLKVLITIVIHTSHFCQSNLLVRCYFDLLVNICRDTLLVLCILLYMYRR